MPVSSVQTTQSSSPGGCFWQGCPSVPAPLQLRLAGGGLRFERPPADTWGCRRSAGAWRTPMLSRQVLSQSWEQT